MADICARGHGGLSIGDVMGPRFLPVVWCCCCTARADAVTRSRLPPAGGEYLQTPAHRGRRVNSQLRPFATDFDTLFASSHHDCPGGSPPIAHEEVRSALRLTLDALRGEILKRRGCRAALIFNSEGFAAPLQIGMRWPARRTCVREINATGIQFYHTNLAVPALAPEALHSDVATSCASRRTFELNLALPVSVDRVRPLPSA